MARDRAGHVNRAFLGLKVLEGDPLPAGTKVFHNWQEVGLGDVELSLPAASVRRSRWRT